MIIQRPSKQTLVLEHVPGCIGVLAETFHDAQV